MFNPFYEKIEADENDLTLINRIRDGGSEDLEKLIFRHQAWIFNIVMKMTMDMGEAEDITQEILIKMVTKLSTFDSEKGTFRTWLYRIVANHVINMKKSKYESIFQSIQEFESLIANMSDEKSEISPETNLMLEELKIKCWSGIILCLNRKHRLVFILGEIFDVKDALGSQIMDISKSNYRKILSRSRKKIYNFMRQKCGLINKKNPCHCEYKIKGLTQKGFIKPDNMQHFQEKAKKIKDVVLEIIDDANQHGCSEHIQIFKNHPFYDPPGFNTWIFTLFKNGKLAKVPIGRNKCKLLEKGEMI